MTYQDWFENIPTSLNENLKKGKMKCKTVGFKRGKGWSFIVCYLKVGKDPCSTRINQLIAIPLLIHFALSYFK